MARDEKKEAEDKAKAEKVIKEITTAMSSMKGKNDEIKELKGRVQAAQSFLNLKGTRATQVLGTLEDIQRQIKKAEEDQKQKLEKPQEPKSEESTKSRKGTVLGAIKSRAATIFGNKEKDVVIHPKEEMTEAELAERAARLQQIREAMVEAQKDAARDVEAQQMVDKLFEESEQENESEDDVVFLNPNAQDVSSQVQEEKGEQAYEAEGEEEVEDIILDDVENNERSVGDDTHAQEAEGGEQEDAEEYIIPGDDYYDKEAASEGVEGREQESEEDMKAKLAAIQAMKEIGEAEIKGVGRSAQGKAETVDEMKEKLKAIQETGHKLEAVMQGLEEQKLSQPADRIFAQTADLVSAGGHIKDQVEKLRTAINEIKKNPEYNQAMIEIKQDAIRENNPTLPERKNSTAALNSEQKEAYRAIARLDKLLSRVEAGNFGIITSMLKGQVKNHLNTMNSEPLKGQIERTINKASAKAEVSPPTTSFKK